MFTMGYLGGMKKEDIMKGRNSDGYKAYMNSQSGTNCGVIKGLTNSNAGEYSVYKCEVDSMRGTTMGDRLGYDNVESFKMDESHQGNVTIFPDLCGMINHR
jgi:hypothetical protein